MKRRMYQRGTHLYVYVNQIHTTFIRLFFSFLLTLRANKNIIIFNIDMVLCLVVNILNATIYFENY
jgi:hypothetical protein